MDFDSKGDALTWEFENQDSRRNLTTGQRIEAAHKVEAITKAEAKERMLAGVKADPRENFPEGQTGRATDKLGAMAGVSRKTYEKGATVFEEAPEEVKNIKANHCRRPPSRSLLRGKLYSVRSRC